MQLPMGHSISNEHTFSTYDLIYSVRLSHKHMHLYKILRL